MYESIKNDNIPAIAESDFPEGIWLVKFKTVTETKMVNSYRNIQEGMRPRYPVHIQQMCSSVGSKLSS